MSALRSLAVGCCLCVVPQARAASLQRITDFGSNPSGLDMYVYVPSRAASSPPIIVAVHDCGGSALSFSAGPAAGLVSGADQYGYIVIFPETVSSASGKCWDVSSKASLAHDGGSDSAGIVSMVKYAIRHYGADANRAYVMGTSSGAMMTNVLLGAYPDVFKAGSAWSGVPFACFAGATLWNPDCAAGQIAKTGQQWGDLVRAAYSGYSGERPRVQLWHGDADTTVSFNNFGEAVKQWTNVLGLSETPSSTEQETPRLSDVRTRYKDACGNVRVEAVRELGQGRNLNIMASEVIRFFALDKTGADPGSGSCGVKTVPLVPALRDLAEARGVYFGCALNPGAVSTGSYGKLAGTEFDCVTPENVMKWDATEPIQNLFSWSGSDDVVSFAKLHGQRIRGHTLLWHKQLPSWVSTLPFIFVKPAMVNHVKTVVGRYAGKIYAWDVVNEILNEDGSLRLTPFSIAMGKDFVAEAFEAAHAADPSAKLYINDYNIESQNAKSNALYELVKSLRRQGVPIDGVGFQCHFGAGFLPWDFQANLQRFAALGIEVAITELDISMPIPASSVSLATQALDYATVVNACLATHGCVGLTVWGIDDGHSWIPQSAPGWGAPLLFDESYNPKPAFTAVQNALASGSSSDKTPPSAPSNLTATETTENAITLTWTASTDDVGVTSYELYDGAVLLASSSATATSYTLTGLSANSSHSFTVRAMDRAGNVSEASNRVAVTTGAVSDTTCPSAPGAPTIIDVTSSSVILTWAASTDDVGVAEYDVFVSSSTGQTQIATNSTTAALSGLAAGTPYTFYVTARDAAGNVSPASGAITAETAATAGGGGRASGVVGCSTSPSSGGGVAFPAFAAFAAWTCRCTARGRCSAPSRAWRGRR